MRKSIGYSLLALKYRKVGNLRSCPFRWVYNIRANIHSPDYQQRAVSFERV